MTLTKEEDHQKLFEGRTIPILKQKIETPKLTKNLLLFLIFPNHLALLYVKSIGVRNYYPMKSGMVYKQITLNNS